MKNICISWEMVKMITSIDWEKSVPTFMMTLKGRHIGWKISIMKIIWDRGWEVEPPDVFALLGLMINHQWTRSDFSCVTNIPSWDKICQRHRKHCSEDKNNLDYYISGFDKALIRLEKSDSNFESSAVGKVVSKKT